MPMTFECPYCGARLEYQGENSSLICQYCGNTVIVPAEIQQAHEEEEVRKMLTWPELRRNRWFQVGVVLFIVIFVLPTCIGLAASLLGIVAGIGVPLVAIILQFLSGH
jgi:DNA-directed RNA polymerase subunit RPC12/RpoP